MGAINDFLSIIKDPGVDGFARVARYEVVLEPPPSLNGLKDTSKIISVMCDSVAMPGHDLQTKAVKFGTALPREMVTGHAYEGTIATTFYIDSQFDLKSYFDVWQEQAVRAQTGRNEVSYYKDNKGNFNYVGSMKIFQLGSRELQGGKAINRDTIGDYGQGAEGPRNENTRHEVHSVTDRTFGINVEEVFPATIGEIEYAYSSVDEIARLTVNFQYRRWSTIVDLALEKKNYLRYGTKAGVR